MHKKSLSISYIISTVLLLLHYSQRKCHTPEGNIVAWQDSQIFSSTKQTRTLVCYILIRRDYILPASYTDWYSPSTRTPLIWVLCIFWSKDRESATRIFLQPSRSRIWRTGKEQAFQWGDCYSELRVGYLKMHVSNCLLADWQCYL